jgi:hypothetical protein
MRSETGQRLVVSSVSQGSIGHRSYRYPDSALMHSAERLNSSAPGWALLRNQEHVQRAITLLHRVRLTLIRQRIQLQWLCPCP